jgi:hypothetical protein
VPSGRHSSPAFTRTAPIEVKAEAAEFIFIVIILIAGTTAAVTDVCVATTAVAAALSCLAQSCCQRIYAFRQRFCFRVTITPAIAAVTAIVIEVTARWSCSHLKLFSHDRFEIRA